MNLGKLARVFLRILAMISILAVFIVLDWYPTVKKLGQLRRERSDLERRIKAYRAMAGTFQFPDQAEESLLAGAEAKIRQALPRSENDDSWAAISIFDLESRVREDGIPQARFLLHWQIKGLELAAAQPAGRDALIHWTGERFGEIQEGFSLVHNRKNSPWQGVLAGWESSPIRPASRPMCAVAMAPLPKMLDFINHLSWGETRLEIVRLYLEPSAPYSRAWLVCRSTCLMRASSIRPWETGGNGGEGPLIDPDSPLLLERIDPFLAPRVEKRDLPTEGSPW